MPGLSVCSGLQIAVIDPMKTHRIMKKFPLILVTVAAMIAVLLRLADRPMLNFSAMGALAVLCGAVLRPSWLSLLVPLACRALTDCILEYRTGHGFYGSMAFDYAAYVAMFAAGRMLQPKHVPAALGTGLLAAAMFFTVSNLGVWCMPHEGQYLYERNLSGLGQCFTMALPFAKGTFLGDVGFTVAFCGAWQLMAALGLQKQAELQPFKK
jgi:hypothetical protein